METCAHNSRILVCVDHSINTSGDESNRDRRSYDVCEKEKQAVVGEGRRSDGTCANKRLSRSDFLSVDNKRLPSMNTFPSSLTVNEQQQLAAIS